jgi:hypothetical protein
MLVLRLLELELKVEKQYKGDESVGPRKHVTVRGVPDAREARKPPIGSLSLS